MAPFGQSEKKFNLIHIEPDAPARSRFKESTIPVHWFGPLVQVGTMEDAVGRLNNGLKADIVFFSYRFADDVIGPFVKSVGESKGGEDAAIVQIMKSDSAGASMASQMLKGVHGFLTEPFSVDGLTEIAMLTVKVKKDKSDEREKAAVRFIVGDIMRQIDRAAFLMSCEMDIGKTVSQIKNLAGIVKGFSGPTLDAYFKVVLEDFENAPLPSASLIKFKNYKGASARVRKQMQEKLLKELDMMDASAAQTPTQS